MLYEEFADLFFWIEKEEVLWTGGYLTELASGYVDDGEMYLNGGIIISKADYVYYCYTLLV